MRATIAGGLLFVSVVQGGFGQTSSPPATDSQSAISEIATGFTNYHQITKSTVFVNPELAALCIGVSSERMEKARIKFGPHANAGILIYMNEGAASAFGTNATVFPMGSVIVKQKQIFGYWDENGKSVNGNTGVGGMVKRQAGYDPEHGDWEYFYFEDVKKIESGRISSCVQCHSSAKNKDYVFGTWSKTVAKTSH
jgi:hypothetical protein